MTLRRFRAAGVLAAAAAVAAAFCLVAGVPAASASTVVQTIPVGPDPYSVSSDGTHVWVTGAGTVTELDASTGAVVQTIPVADGADFVSSDGTHVWVTGQQEIVRLVRSPSSTPQPARLSRPAGWATAAGVSSDGTHVWVSSYASGNVTELDASTGAVAQIIPCTTRSAASPPMAPASGSRTWTARSPSWTPRPARSSRTSPSPGGAGGVSSDGTHVWVTGNDTVTELDASTGAVVQNIPVAGAPARSPPMAPTSGSPATTRSPSWTPQPARSSRPSRSAATPSASPPTAPTSGSQTTTAAR